MGKHQRLRHIAWMIGFWVSVSNTALAQPLTLVSRPSTPNAPLTYLRPAPLTYLHPALSHSTQYPASAGFAIPRKAHPFANVQSMSDSLSTHSPKKATILALTLPGSGQIYNRKYWKVPLVYAGMGGSIYAIGKFRSNMRQLNDSISHLYSLGKTPNAQLIQDRDNQRSRRDVAILCLTGVYVLQVLDAVVDAHFYKFNINDKIAVECKPAPTQLISLHYQL